MRISIIGGGASGMMAAISAKKKNPESQVTIYEKNSRMGKKLLATGNGRCNYTNAVMEDSRFHSSNTNFPDFPLNSFNLEKTLDFFESLGITPYYDESGKIFPFSLQSSSILDVLRYEIEELGIDVKYEIDIKAVKRHDNGFRIIDNLDNLYESDRVVIAVGGCALPSSGSDGSGYSMAKSLGHSIVKPFPAIVQLNAKSEYSKAINGVRIVSQVSLKDADGNVLADDFGDLLFTSYGVSGPTVLNLSRLANEYLNASKKVNVSINLMRDMSEADILKLLEARMANLYYKSIEEALIGLIHKKLIIPLLKYCSIDRRTVFAELGYDSLKRLANGIGAFEFEVTSSQGFEQAQVSCGGVDTKDVDEYTLESKLCPGLYFAGEVLDVDGDCGGYNLQWAWSSGYIAGTNAAKPL